MRPLAGLPASSRAPASPCAAPHRLGPYELVARIADGGMATVFVARLTHPAEEPAEADGAVAIKMIRDDLARNGEFLTMFMDEARIASRLRHPNVVRTREVGRDGAHVFIAMDLLLGQSLWAVWEACRARGMRLGYETIAWIGARVADGLHYAHEMVDEDGKPLDIVHRDVNATNIFVTYDGQVKVIDFGLAKAGNRASKTAAGIIKGKIAYMAPEQSVGAPVDRRTDVFALGTTLWELACDRRLFKRPDEAETLRLVHAAEVPDPTRLVSGFPPALWRVLQRALAREKERRYPTAAELARDLDAFGRGSGTKAVDCRTIAETMSELFDGDHAPHATRARPHGYSRSAQMRSPELQEVDVTYSRPNAVPGCEGLSPVASDKPGSRKGGGPLRVAVTAAVVIALVVASIVSLR